MECQHEDGACMPIGGWGPGGPDIWPRRTELDLPARLALDFCRAAAVGGAAHPALARLVWQTCGLAAVEPILAAVADIAQLTAAAGRRPCFRPLADSRLSGSELILLGVVAATQREDLAAAGLGAVTLMRGRAAAALVANAMVLGASLAARGYALALRPPPRLPPRPIDGTEAGLRRVGVAAPF